MNQFRFYIVKRLGYMLVTLWLVSLIVFAVTAVLPGNAAEMILGTHATPAKVEALEQSLGLSEPLHVQYLDWIVGFVTGNWGTSYHFGVPIAELIWTRLARTLQIAVFALLLLVVVAIPLGVIAAVYRDSPLDLSITSASYVGISVPEFVTGALLIMLFGGPVFDVFPVGGYAAPSEGIGTWLQHMVLPVVTVTVLLTAHIVRLTRSEMIETLRSDYVRTARLKGMGESGVLFKHGLRNGLLPTITLLALDIGYLMGSLVVIEEIFSFPGLGRLVVQAIQARDIPVLQDVILIVAITYTVANLVADLLYSYLDPRIDYGSSSGAH